MPRKMRAVLITCEKTQTPVATGLRLSQIDFAMVQLKAQFLWRCEACGSPHIWNKWQARLHSPQVMNA